MIAPAQLGIDAGQRGAQVGASCMVDRQAYAIGDVYAGPLLGTVYLAASLFTLIEPSIRRR